MEPRTGVDWWRWPCALGLGLGMMSLAVVAAGIAHFVLMALPHWAHATLSFGGLACVAIVITVVARRRRRVADQTKYLPTRR